jgi:GntR family transcriptional regulator / MocR family aminotransferase
MVKRAGNIMLEVAVNFSANIPLHRQLYMAIKGLILDGRLRPGSRLPSTRTIADDLKLSRTTVLNAFEQLSLEGYLEGKVGSGTQIARSVPGHLERFTNQGKARLPSARRKPRISRRARQYSAADLTFLHTSPRPLRPGVPDMGLFPLKLWSRLAAKHWRQARDHFGQFADSSGYGPLREAICEYVSRLRAVRCEPAQVLIVGGAQQALYLCAQTLLDPGESVWIEDPGYPRARAAFLGAGLKLIPIPVDSDGMVVSAGNKTEANPKLVYVTPSFQCPLGSMMSLPRRFELLRLAKQKNTWILEDDYFSEYRYGSNPVASLQSLDRNERVIYIGNFSKSIVPFLRIGFVIVPPALIDIFRRARSTMSRQPPGVDQAALAEFILEGHLERHVRATLDLYRDRQETLVDAIRQKSDGMLKTWAPGTAMYLVAWLRPGINDRAVAKAAFAGGVDVVPLSTFAMRQLSQGGLVLGYSGYNANSIRGAVDQLCASISKSHLARVPTES